MNVTVKAVFLLALVLLVLLDCCVYAKNKAMVLRQKETNAIEFIRLTVMRMVYGLATRFGFGEQISEALNGAFVPPGVDADYDYDSAFGLFDRPDDEDDYY